MRKGWFFFFSFLFFGMLLLWEFIESFLMLDWLACRWKVEHHFYGGLHNALHVCLGLMDLILAISTDSAILVKLCNLLVCLLPRIVGEGRPNQLFDSSSLAWDRAWKAWQTSQVYPSYCLSHFFHFSCFAYSY